MKNTTQKPFTLFVMFLVSICVTGCSQDFEKISRAQAGEDKIEMGKKFNDRFYNKLKQGDAYEFSSEATEEVKRQISPEMQKSLYKQVKDQFGDYVDSEFAEAWIQKSKPQYKILRYKGKFSKSETKLELRVIYNDANKVAGFFIKPWSDMLN